jgi:hypothetical protein
LLKKDRVVMILHYINIVRVKESLLVTFGMTR